MVARQSKMAIKNHNTEYRVKTHTYKPGSPHQTLLKYKNTVSQKTSYRDTELQIQVLTASKISKGGKEARLKEEGGRGGRGGSKGVALQTSSDTCRYPGIMGLHLGPPEKGGLELGPTRNQTRPESEFEFSTKRR